MLAVHRDARRNTGRNHSTTVGRLPAPRRVRTSCIKMGSRRCDFPRLLFLHYLLCLSSTAAPRKCCRLQSNLWRGVEGSRGSILRYAASGSSPEKLALSSQHSGKRGNPRGELPVAAWSRTMPRDPSTPCRRFLVGTRSSWRSGRDDSLNPRSSAKIRGEVFPRFSLLAQQYQRINRQSASRRNPRGHQSQQRHC